MRPEVMGVLVRASHLEGNRDEAEELCESLGVEYRSEIPALHSDAVLLSNLDPTEQLGSEAKEELGRIVSREDYHELRRAGALSPLYFALPLGEQYVLLAVHEIIEPLVSLDAWKPS